MSPAEHYSALIRRLTDWSIESVCGKGKKPKGDRQVAEIERRLSQTIENALMFHIDPTYHPKQAWFLELLAPIVVACTGNKFGKTFALLLKALVATLGCAPWDPEQTHRYNPIKHEPPVEITLCGPDFATWLPLNIVPRLKKLIPWDAIVVKTSRIQGAIIDGIEFWNGTTWKILSYVQEDARFEGWSTHLCLWDEPMPMSKYVAASRGCIEHGAPHAMSYTPLSEAWVYDEFYDRGFLVDTQEAFEIAKQGTDDALFDQGRQRPLVVVGTMYDNHYLSRKEQERFDNDVLRKKPEEREARVYGKHRSLQGLIWKNFSLERHVKDLSCLV